MLRMSLLYKQQDDHIKHIKHSKNYLPFFARFAAGGVTNMYLSATHRTFFMNDCLSLGLLHFWLTEPSVKSSVVYFGDKSRFTLDDVYRP